MALFSERGKTGHSLLLGHQHILINTALLSYDIDWPSGTEGDTKTFSNVLFDDDLFTFAERREVLEDDLDADSEKEADED